MSKEPREKERTFEELSRDKAGTVYHESMDDGMRFIVLRGPVSLCAYLGVPKDHPLAGFDYDSIPLDCHGGLTYAGDGTSFLEGGRYWYGWDYAHSGDRCFYDAGRPDKDSREERGWVVGDVIKDSFDARYGMGKLLKIAERIFQRVKWGAE